MADEIYTEQKKQQADEKWADAIEAQQVPEDKKVKPDPDAPERGPRKPRIIPNPNEPKKKPRYGEKE